MKVEGRPRKGFNGRKRGDGVQLVGKKKKRGDGMGRDERGGENRTRCGITK